MVYTSSQRPIFSMAQTSFHNLTSKSEPSLIPPESYSVPPDLAHSHQQPVLSSQLTRGISSYQHLPLQQQSQFQPNILPIGMQQGNSSNQSTILNHPYINIPRLSCFSGDSKKNEVDYIQWKFELDTLIQLNYPEAIIIHAMGKSLKPPAANVLRSMGPKPVLSV